MLSKTSRTSPRFNVEPGLFQHLAADAVAKFLAELQHAAGNGPLALERLGRAAHQQHTVPINDHRANSDDGLFGIIRFIAGPSCQAKAFLSFGKEVGGGKSH